MKQNRDITSLENGFELRFKTAMDEYNSKNNPKIFIVEALRTKEQQLEYYRQWKSRTKNSNHMNGKAVDIAFKPWVLYPTDDKTWEKVCEVMRKYGIVNWYYDLMRHKAKKWPIVDKPHFQAVEVQLPTVSNINYDNAKNWREWLELELKRNWSARHIVKTLFARDKLHKRNNLIRELLKI